jgi:hypothetical protein
LAFASKNIMTDDGWAVAAAVAAATKPDLFSIKMLMQFRPERRINASEYEHISMFEQ